MPGPWRRRMPRRRNRTGWAGADDGILDFDHDGDGRATDRSEIVLADYGLPGMTDLEDLAHVFDGSGDGVFNDDRSEENTSELQSLMRNAYAVFCLKNIYKR